MALSVLFVKKSVSGMQELLSLKVAMNNPISIAIPECLTPSGGLKFSKLPACSKSSSIFECLQNSTKGSPQ
jgi:hypothetical protein